MKRATVVLLAVATLFFVMFVAVPLMLFSQQQGGAGDGTCLVSPKDAARLKPVAGYRGEQLSNAAFIMSAAQDLKLGLRGQQIGVMTAMEESTLNNLAYGDNAINPDGSIADSIGLFQQQGNWGTVKERMTPYTAATLFFKPMSQLANWQKLPPETVAHAVQRNDFAWRYAEHWKDAQSVVTALTDAASCSAGSVPAGGWTNPVGMQTWGTYPGHSGGAMDIHVGVGTPVRAPAGGTVVDLSEGCGGRVLGVQHDRRYTTVFAHLSAFAVKPGTKVRAGQLIAYSGASGSCVDGAHLHFEIRVGPDPKAWGSFSFTPTYRFMREHGVTLGPCTTGCDLYPR